MKSILNKIFPKTIDNSFNGNKIAVYVFYILTAVTLWRSQHHMFAFDGGAQSIASVPLDQFTTDGANAVISIFAFWGLSQILLGLVYLVVSIRYKALIPFFYLLMLAEYVGRILVEVYKPLPTLETAPGQIGNYIFIVVSIAMLLLSLKDKKNS